MRTRGVAWSAVGFALLLAAACGDDTETEVAGVVIDEDIDDPDAADQADDEPVDDDTDEADQAGTVAPLVLGDVVSDLGVSHRFEDDGVELGSGQVLESDDVTRHLVADVLLDGDQARCQVTLHAPSDRGLEAGGHLSVELVLEGRDGGLERLELDAADLDVVLPAGGHESLAPTAPHQVDTDALRSLWCEARHR